MTTTSTPTASGAITPRRSPRPPARGVTALVVLAAVALAGNPLAAWNSGGLDQVASFFAAAASPELSGDFLALVWRESLVTVSYAVLGTALAMVLGLLGSVVLARRWWSDPSGGRAGVGWQAVRSIAVLPRSLHEVVWGLLLLNVLGLDPLVAVLAIGIPFGAITAKVFADAVDDADPSAFTALRAAGAGRLSALAYGVWPAIRSDVASYGLYRFECSVRSAAILGIVGAGGLGFQLTLSFTSLRYGEVWTALWGRLLAEALEGTDEGPALALRAAGASKLEAAAYATVPAALDRFVSLGLYRWEVAIRETVVVGVVGAGGLGRALDQELSSFAWSNVTGILLALVAVTFLVDAVSAALRRRRP